MQSFIHELFTERLVLCSMLETQRRIRSSPCVCPECELTREPVSYRARRSAPGRTEEKLASLRMGLAKEEPGAQEREGGHCRPPPSCPRGEEEPKQGPREGRGPHLVGGPGRGPHAKHQTAEPGGGSDSGEWRRARHDPQLRRSPGCGQSGHSRLPVCTLWPLWLSPAILGVPLEWDFAFLTVGPQRLARQAAGSEVRGLP